MRRVLLLLVPLLVPACSGVNADACLKGDDEACHKACETGKEEFQSLCFMPRARKALACAENGADCEAACKEWPKKDTMDDEYRKIYEGNVGDTAKVNAIDAACAKFDVPAAP